ncbi:unnamed protein product [Lepeophtheirus salmonis]|uniref:(salmon louse) hypothetical protein n=1 Tax=Lepeophtheirus salmonis TaxID=72036 RepID=A0A7R8HEJ3_LEPSM|nr:unnamed protein product [Lepeophtheirus salmonis]CAF3045961.1 unnamed protein product [Lepeophtheirus salmonis]
MREQVIPRTLQVRNNPTRYFSQQTRKEWDDALNKESLQSLKVALRDTEKKVKETLDKLSEAMNSLRKPCIETKNTSIIKVIEANGEKYELVATNQASKRFFSSQSQWQSILQRSHGEGIQNAKKEIKEVLNGGILNGFIDEDEFSCMIREKKKGARFYVIFKIHRDHPKGSLPQRRPIIYGNESITEKLSQFVTFH